MRLLALTSTLLTLIFALCIGLIRMRPAEPSSVGELFAAFDDPACAENPCLLGVHVGMSKTQAATTLEAHEWVESVDVLRRADTDNDGWIRWYFDSDADLTAWTYKSGAGFHTQFTYTGGDITHLTLNSTFTLAEIWLTVGAPETAIMTVYDGDGSLSYEAYYPQHGFMLTLYWVNCPMDAPLWAYHPDIVMAPVETSTELVGRVDSPSLAVGACNAMDMSKVYRGVG